MAFPSAHAANSMVAWLGLALIAAPPKARPAAVAAALALALTVGLTRLVLAVHWPSDVIGGWSFGAAWTLVVLRRCAGMAPLAPRGLTGAGNWFARQTETQTSAVHRVPSWRSPTLSSSLRLCVSA